MITDAAIKSAMKIVTSTLTLRDKSNGRGAGTLILVVRRLRDGSASAQWQVLVERGGRRQKKQIGRYPEMTLAMARQYMAAEVSPALVAGKSLRVAHQGERPTVEAMFTGYVQSMRDAGKVSAEEVERVLLRAKSGSVADMLGRTRLAGDIDAADVSDVVARFYQRGSKSAADKARVYMVSAFNWARKNANDYRNPNRRDWGVKGNPAEDVPRDPEANRTIERNLSALEVCKLWHGADYRQGTFSIEVAAAVRLLIATGQRVKEVLRIDGSEIDLENAVWIMPREKTKMRLREHPVPLPRQIIPTLEALKVMHGDGPLFPSRDGAAEHGRILERSVRQAVTRWLDTREAEGIPHFTPRDLRRTWKSRMMELDTDERLVDAMQQHDQGGTSRRNYNRADYLPKFREQMAKWEGWLDAALELKQLQADKAA